MRRTKFGGKGVSRGGDVASQSAPEKHRLRAVLSPSIVGLFFIIIFFWYSQITEVPFTAGVGFIKSTFLNLHKFFTFESRAGGNVPAVLGEDIISKGVPHQIEFVLTWIIFAFIAIGAIAMLRRVIFSHSSEGVKRGPIKANFEVAYLVMTLLCGALLVAMVALPGVGTGYGIQRGYTQASVILSVSFVVAAIILSKYIRVKPYLLILLVMIPYFFCVSGLMYQVFGYPRDITLNSQERLHTNMYISDAESYAAKWVEQYNEEEAKIYVNGFSREILLSQGKIPYHQVSTGLVSRYEEGKEIDGYIWLRYVDMIDGGLVTEYPAIFAGKSKIYANGSSETYR